MSARYTAARLVFLIVLLTGCLKAELDLVVDADRTVHGSLLLAYDRAAVVDAGQDPAQAQSELLGDVRRSAPEGMACEEFEDDRYIGADCRLHGVTFDRFSQIESFGQSLTITEAGDQVVFAGVIDLQDVAADDPEVTDSFDVTIRVTFPGPVVEGTNGTVEGTTVTWRPEPGQRMQMRAVAARSAAPPPSDLLWLVGGAGILLIVLAAAVVVAYRVGRSRATPAPY